MRRPHLLNRLRWCLVASPLSLLTGCALFSIEPTWELIKATGATAGYIVARGPASAQDTVHHAHDKPSAVCIAYNPGVPSSEVVPALQSALARQQVDSRVFPEGASPTECPVWLHYTGYVAWDLPPLSKTHRPYLAHIALTLKTMNGQVLSSSAYELGGPLSSTKWTSTQDKVTPVVQALLTGFTG